MCGFCVVGCLLFWRLPRAGATWSKLHECFGKLIIAYAHYVRVPTRTFRWRSCICSFIAFMSQVSPFGGRSGRHRMSFGRRGRCISSGASKRVDLWPIYFKSSAYDRKSLSEDNSGQTSGLLSHRFCNQVLILQPIPTLVQQKQRLD